MSLVKTSRAISDDWVRVWGWPGNRDPAIPFNQVEYINVRVYGAALAGKWDLVYCVVRSHIPG